MSKKRLFVAINLPDEVRQRLSVVSQRLKMDFIRWTSLANLHITVHFIGGVEDEQIPDLTQNIARIVASFRPFELVSDELKVIKKRRKPVMIWASFFNQKVFDELSFRLREVIPGDGSKPPNPHVTLARIKSKRPIDLKRTQLPEVGNYSFIVDRIELWESVLSNSEPVYKSLESFRFE